MGPKDTPVTTAVVNPTFVLSEDDETVLSNEDKLGEEAESVASPDLLPDETRQKQQDSQASGPHVAFKDDGGGTTTPPEPEVPKNQNVVPFLSLFRFANSKEKVLTVVGLLFGFTAGFSLPILNIVYGEYAEMFVERQFPSDKPSTKTIFLAGFGGGQVLVNASQTERASALQADANAFAICCLTLSSLQFMLGAISLFLLNYTSTHQITRMRGFYFRKIMAMHMGWFDVHGAKDFTTKMTEGFPAINHAVGERFAYVTYEVTMTALHMAISLFYGWVLTLAMLPASFLIFLCTVVSQKVQSRLTAEELKSYSFAGAVAEEVISNIRTVVAFNGEQKESLRYSDMLTYSKTVGNKKGLLGGLGQGLVVLVTYGCFAVAFAYGIRLVMESRANGDDVYSPGVLVIVFFGVLTATSALGFAMPNIETFSAAKGAGTGIFRVFNTESKIDSLNMKGKRPDDSVEGEVVLKNVWFSYPSRPDVHVLRDVNLRVQPGEVVALVGESGSGKSTVLQLVQRFYDPTQGEVLLDGHNLKDLCVSWLRRQLAVVGQEPVLFSGSVGENISYGMLDATQVQIQASAEKAGAHGFISGLENGYSSNVGQRGSTLSGGQKQRIAIARALVRNPKILLLDEPTSALDVTSCRSVESALKEASKGRTTLMITHKLSQARIADRIVVMADGAVIEQGSHQELIQREGLYVQLLKAQNDLAPEPKKSVSLEPDTLTLDAPLGIAYEEKLIHMANHSRPASLRMSITPVIGGKDQVVPISVWNIFRWNRPELTYLVLGCIASIILGCGLPAICILFGSVYGSLSLTDTDEILRLTDMYTVIVVVLGVVMSSAAFSQAYILGRAAVQMTTRLREQSFTAVMNQEMAWFDNEQNRVGALCSRLSLDAASVQGIPGCFCGLLLQSCTTLVVAISLSYYYTWKLTMVAIFVVPFVFLGVYMESVLLARTVQQERAALETATKVAVEAISNIKCVAAFGLESLFIKKFEEALAAMQEDYIKKALVRAVSFSVSQVTSFVAYGLVLWYGGYLIAGDDLHYQNVIKSSELLVYGSWFVGLTMITTPSFPAARNAAGRLQFLFKRRPLVTSGERTKPPDWDTSLSTIDFKKVAFNYPSRPTTRVLRNLNLTIQKGQSVALVGQSGCGKSTIVQLLQRLYNPTDGSVHMDGVDIADYDLTVLRNQLGIVSQEPVLFDRSIRDNIAYGDNSRVVPEIEIMEAARAAQIHNFIMTLPQRYDTRMGAGGGHMSGGQKQRIAIARALVRNPRILLLDEATSALDPQSERVVQEALEAAASGRTTITIAHRMSAVVNADVIFVIEKGVVAEYGTHAKLMASGGIYKQSHEQPWGQDKNEEE